MPRLLLSKGRLLSPSLACGMCEQVVVVSAASSASSSRPRDRHIEAARAVSVSDAIVGESESVIEDAEILGQRLGSSSAVSLEARRLDFERLRSAWRRCAHSHRHRNRRAFVCFFARATVVLKSCSARKCATLGHVSIIQDDSGCEKCGSSRIICWFLSVVLNWGQSLGVWSACSASPLEAWTTPKKAC